MPRGARAASTADASGRFCPAAHGLHTARLHHWRADPGPLRQGGSAPLRTGASLLSWCAETSSFIPDAISRLHHPSGRELPCTLLTDEHAGPGDGQTPAQPPVPGQIPTRVNGRHQPAPRSATDTRPVPRIILCVGGWTEVSCQGHWLSLSVHQRCCGHMGSSSPCPPTPRCPDCPLRKCGSPLKVSLGVNTTDTHTRTRTDLAWRRPVGSSPIHQSERFLSSHVAGGHRRRTAEVCTVMGKKKKPARRSERPRGEPLLTGVAGGQSSQSGPCLRRKHRLMLQ